MAGHQVKGRRKYEEQKLRARDGRVKGRVIMIIDAGPENKDESL